VAELGRINDGLLKQLQDMEEKCEQQVLLGKLNASDESGLDRMVTTDDETADQSPTREELDNGSDNATTSTVEGSPAIESTSTSDLPSIQDELKALRDPEDIRLFEDTLPDSASTMKRRRNDEGNSTGQTEQLRSPHDVIARLKVPARTNMQNKREEKTVVGVNIATLDGTKAPENPFLLNTPFISAVCQRDLASNKKDNYKRRKTNNGDSLTVTDETNYRKATSTNLVSHRRQQRYQVKPAPSPQAGSVFVHPEQDFSFAKDKPHVSDADTTVMKNTLNF
jgi:hypothetical protein